MKKRIFIAINLPNKIKKELADVQNQLAEFDLPIRWTKIKNIHLTLVFLGYIEEKKVTEVTKVIEALINKVRSFEISIKNLGVFPNFKNPRIIWIGIENNKDLINLRNGLVNNLRGLKFKIEKRDFSPHLTLGRTKKRISVKAGNLENIYKKIGKVDLEKFRVESVEIMESKLKVGGFDYKEIKSIKLTPLVK